METCSHSGCLEDARAAGLCAHHYYTPEAKAAREAVRFSHRPCIICAADLYGRQANTITCSPRCRTAYHERDRRAASLARRTGRHCVICGAEIFSHAGKSSTCSRECATRFARQNRDAKRDAEWALRKKPCLRCGQELPEGVRRGSIYCSRACRLGTSQPRWKARSSGYMRRRAYGITPERFAEMLASQGGRCAICRTDQPNGKGFNLDHDHATGAVRGILCGSCNNGLGRFADDPARLRAAAAYLEARAAS